MTVLTGIDVSRYQSTTDYTLPDGLSFLFARASIGTQTDTRYDAHIAKARSAGLLTGAYHFAYDQTSVNDQVALFIATAGDVDAYALDVEGAHGFDLAQTRDFIDRFHALTGKRIGLYMSESQYYTFDAHQDWRWVANWSREPVIPWQIWQYGSHEGEDGDRFRGTLADLRALFGAKEAPVASAINGGSRILASDYTRTLGIGAVLYKDTDGTKFGTLAAVTVRDDGGVPVGASGWAYVAHTSAGFDADTTQENGWALVRLDDPKVGPLVQKDAAALVTTAARFAPTLTQADIEVATAPLTAQVTALQTELAAAAVTERERIAAAEANRIKSL